MKILLASPYRGVPGGISRWTEHILNYYNSTDDKGVDLTLLEMNRSVFVDIDSNLWFRIASGLKDYRNIVKDFKACIRQEHFDVLHLVSSASISLTKDIYMLRLAKKHSLKTVIHFHFGRIPEIAAKNNWEWKLLQKVVRLADKAVVIDRFSYDTLTGRGFDNVVMLPNPIAPAVNEIIRKNVGVERKPGTVLFTGHMVRTKGIYELVDACRRLDNIRLKMVGYVTPDVRAELQELSGNADWLEITGEKPYDEVIKDMLECDVFVLPTYTEGFPNVILESMACGCAIVSTTVGAIPEMLAEKDGRRYGILVEPRNVQQLRDAIREMLGNEQLKTECRMNVRERVNERYNIQSVWNRLTGIWKSCL